MVDRMILIVASRSSITLASRSDACGCSTKRWALWRVIPAAKSRWIARSWRSRAMRSRSSRRLTWSASRLRSASSSASAACPAKCGSVRTSVAANGGRPLRRASISTPLSRSLVPMVTATAGPKPFHLSGCAVTRSSPATSGTVPRQGFPRYSAARCRDARRLPPPGPESRPASLLGHVEVAEHLLTDPDGHSEEGVHGRVVVTDQLSEDSVPGRQITDLGTQLVADAHGEEFRELLIVPDHSQGPVLRVDQYHCRFHDPRQDLGQVEFAADRHDRLQQAVQTVASAAYLVDPPLELIEQLIQPRARKLAARGVLVIVDRGTSKGARDRNSHLLPR
ncbi:hypothetical protein ABIC27_000884 [Streptomyces sp. PvR034]